MFPEIVIFNLHIPSFFFAMSLNMMACLTLLFFLIRSKAFDWLSDLGFQESDGFDLAIIIMLSGFFGGRLMHVLYELPEYYIEHPIQVFQFWMGGFVYYGGMMTSVGAALLWLWWKLKTANRLNQMKLSFQHWGDILAPCLSMSYMLGRVGCFLEGCCFGKFTSVSWAVQLRHPTQIYASLTELFSFLVVLFLLKRPLHKMQPGGVFLVWLFMHSSFRIFMEFFRDDFRGIQVFGLSISTVISVILMTFSLTTFWRMNKSLLEAKTYKINPS